MEFIFSRIHVETMASAWIEALKRWNAGRGGKYTVPKRGSAEYEEVKKLMGEAPMTAKVAKAPKAKDIMMVEAKSATVKPLSKKEVEVKIVEPKKIEVPATVEPMAPVKRGRGRPRKVKPAEEPPRVVEPTMEVREVERAPEPVVSTLEAQVGNVSEPVVKRGRGRPRKEKKEEGPKRPRGRPRKEKPVEAEKQPRKAYRVVKVVRPPEAKEEPKPSKIAEVGKRVVARKKEERMERTAEALATGVSERAIDMALRELMAEIRETKQEIREVKEDAKATRTTVKNGAVEKEIKRELKTASAIVGADTRMGEEEKRAFDSSVINYDKNTTVANANERTLATYNKYYKPYYLLNDAVIQAITDGVLKKKDMKLLKELPNGNKTYELPITKLTKKPGSAIKSITVIMNPDGMVVGAITVVEVVEGVRLSIQNAETSRPFRISVNGAGGTGREAGAEALAMTDPDLSLDTEAEEMNQSEVLKMIKKE